MDQDNGVDHLWEQAHICYANDKEIAGALIKKLFAKNYHYSIANIFHDWSLKSPEFNKHTGEFMKLGHDKASAYFYHILNPDQMSYYKNNLQEQLDGEKMPAVASAFQYAYHNHLIDEEVKQVLEFATLKIGNVLLANKILNADALAQQIIELSSLPAITIQCLRIGLRCRP